VAYDLIVVGGGLAGASLARRMAAAGARVLILERETQFRDRIRGEALQPWGVAEMRKLGVDGPLAELANELRSFDQSFNGHAAFRRDLRATTLVQEPMWGFYHPTAQERLLAAAMTAGVEVRRGSSVQRIVPGARPRLTLGDSTTLEARLVVLCCGRNPALRAELGFTARRGSVPLFLSGVRLTGLSPRLEPDVAYVGNDFTTGAVAALFRQPGDYARAYFGYHPQNTPRLQGDADFPRFRELFQATAGASFPFGDARPVGPLASFECADVWVDHPYRDGVALAGDSAASNDPSWGQGLALAFRDARVLSDELLAGDDWDAAAHRYAQRHDEHYGRVSQVSGWFYDMFQGLGPEADAARARALPLIAADQTRVPDTLFSGPDWPLPPDAHQRFFAEDQLAPGARP
jgi:2-polyprenyl-6-methoxyphenol hydroxylase-like FAD-dependent oxidoreductase